jgi:pyruvate,water dikinase
VVTSKEDAARVRPGDVVIVPDSSPAWTSFFDKAVAVVAERGGELSAMAIAARERGVPLALCVKNAVELIQDGSNVLVNATAGKVRWHAAGHNTPYMCDLRRSQE